MRLQDVAGRTRSVEADWRRRSSIEMWSNVACFALACVGVGLASAADNPTFMMVSGISAPEEMCLTTGVTLGASY